MHVQISTCVVGNISNYHRFQEYQGGGNWGYLLPGKCSPLFWGCKFLTFILCNWSSCLKLVQWTRRVWNIWKVCKPLESSVIKLYMTGVCLYIFVTIYTNPNKCSNIFLFGLWYWSIFSTTYLGKKEREWKLSQMRQWWLDIHGLYLSLAHM